MGVEDERARASGDGSAPDAGGDAVVLPRGTGVRMRAAHIVRIVILAAALVVLAMFGRTCADGVAAFVMSFGPPATEAGSPGQIDRDELRRLTDEEIREQFPSLIERDAGAGGAAAAEAEAGDAGAGAALGEDASEPEREPNGAGAEPGDGEAAFGDGLAPEGEGGEPDDGGDPDAFEP